MYMCSNTLALYIQSQAYHNIRIKIKTCYTFLSSSIDILITCNRVPNMRTTHDLSSTILQSIPQRVLRCLPMRGRCACPAKTTRTTTTALNHAQRPPPPPPSSSLSALPSCICRSARAHTHEAPTATAAAAAAPARSNTLCAHCAHSFSAGPASQNSEQNRTDLYCTIRSVCTSASAKKPNHQTHNQQHTQVRRDPQPN